MSEFDYVRQLARKAAILEGCIYVVYKNADYTYSFDKAVSVINKNIVEYIHFL